MWPQIRIAEGTKEADGEEMGWSAGAAKAHAYVREMWRVLSLGGAFVAVTTMPPEVFEALAVAALDQTGGGGGGDGGGDSGGEAPADGRRFTHECTDWRTCKKEKLKTPEGGDVWVYVLHKTGQALVEYSKGKRVTPRPLEGATCQQIH